MANPYSMDDVVDFLTHASERGLMPATTTTSLAVAVRNVFGILTEDERGDLSRLDLDDVIRRFTNKRAREFSPSSLKEYGRRVHRAVDLFQSWRDDPANFSVKTRTTSAGEKRRRNGGATPKSRDVPAETGADTPPANSGGYSSSISVRPDWVVTISNLPADLTPAEAERLAKFVRMLPIE